MPNNEIILEFISLGAYVKINAIDTKTGVEATAIAPANLRRDEMKTLALRKLEYVMKKKKSASDDFLV